MVLELDLAQIQLDLDGDGQSAPGETLLAIFSVVVGPARVEEGFGVDFDRADAAWLQAYSHLLMAMADFLAAHDWQAAYDATFEGLFPQSFTPQTVLNAMTREAAQRMAELQAEMPEPPSCQQWTDKGLDEECAALHQEFQQHAAVLEMQALRMAVEYGSIADIVAFIHLLRWPVDDAERLAASLDHLERMVVLSRATWDHVLAETDDAREWLPSPKQTGIFTSLPIGQEQVDGWLAFLDVMDGVLKGEMLLPHWRFAQGFNMRRMFLEPRQFDLVMMVHGAGVIPYLEDGPIADQATWSRAIEVFGGDFFSYFVWIN